MKADHKKDMIYGYENGWENASLEITTPSLHAAECRVTRKPFLILLSAQLTQHRQKIILTPAFS